MNDIKLIIDIGARNTDLPYKYPEAVCHLFEPSKSHFENLQKQFNNWPVILNNYGIGDKKEILTYNVGSESFVLGGGGYDVQLETLDWYIKKHKITQIDFLKIDTEGMDYRIIKGNPKALKITKYLQFETWDNPNELEALLNESLSNWYTVDIGERNVLCKKKNSNSAS